MKKINLKNILKKTFKTNKKKKTVKKVKIKQLKKKSKKITKPLKKQKENNKDKNIAKTSSLRIPKQNEQKPEIKKIKKQETEKKEFKPKDYVVYPKHGVGQILSVSTRTIGGIEVQCYNVKFEKDKAIGLLPINKQSHLRPLSTINQVNKSISIFKSKPKIKRSMWSRRAQEYEQKITSGKIYELAEVVRDLNKGDDIMVDQSYSERQLFEKAYERILSEFQIVLKLSTEDTQKKLNKALKRNLENQIQSTGAKPLAKPEEALNEVNVVTEEAAE
ncbi:MAG: transcriptional regulator [Pelagibacterales bacterium]|nr:transcriptional regulator [Pelagibacterales bacterium]